MPETKYTPFNGLKALTHVEYWKSIVDTKHIPFPRFVSIDPCGVCDYACPFCNAAEIMNQHGYKMDIKMIDSIINLLSLWKTKAVCIGGGGESLLNPNTSYLIENISALKLDIGVVTNGTKIPQHKNSLLKCKWVGISMDAGTKETYMKMKGISTDKWDLVKNNIRSLSHQGTEISWKFLVHPDNFSEVYEAAKEAKECGCDLIHIRPGSDPWFRSNKDFNYTESSIEAFRQNINSAIKDFEDDSFKIFVVDDKFTKNWRIKNNFKKCYSIFTTCFIDSKGNIGLCCDRRGDKDIMLGNLSNIMEKWGSQEHWDIHNRIKVQSCPRCTMSNVNEIFENVIIEDKMFYNMY